MNPKRVLLIDDEAVIVKLIQSRLQANGYLVETATQGTEGIRKAQEIPPNMILLDIKMPDLDGYRVCEHLKQNERTREIPIIIFTASQEKGLEFKCLSAGAATVLQKPFEASELISLMEEIWAG